MPSEIGSHVDGGDYSIGIPGKKKIRGQINTAAEKERKAVKQAEGGVLYLKARYSSAIATF